MEWQIWPGDWYLDIGVLLLALALDMVFRELPTPLHPVVWIGKLISLLKRLGPSGTRSIVAFGWGTLVAIFVPVMTAGFAWIIANGLRELGAIPYLLGCSVLLSTTFAVRGLAKAAQNVQHALETDSIDHARNGLESLVSRNATELDRPLVAAAAIESVAENTTDSYIAPWLAFAILGLPGAFVYRAINTLDSMIGYRGEYEYLGKASAKLDDAVNLVAARLSALLILLAGILLKLSVARGWKWALSGRRITASPNAGWTIGAMSGLLGVVLEKPGSYRIGDGMVEPRSQDIGVAVRVAYLVAIFGDSNVDRRACVARRIGRMTIADQILMHARPEHGGINTAELDALGLRAEQVIDFSASINPLGPSTRAIEAAKNADFSTYPDPDCVRLREAISRDMGVVTNRIFVGNGSTEIIYLLARTYLSNESTASVFGPTFGEYASACKLQEVTPFEIMPNLPEFRWDIEKSIKTIRERRPSLTFLCNPNNPTGVYLSEQEVASIAAAVDGLGLLILDEAYTPFVASRWDVQSLPSLSNVVILRSMTKDYALTGLRMGYMLADEDVVERVRNYQPTWSVNGPAQAAGIAALCDREHVNRGRQVVRDGREFLIHAARSLGLEFAPSAANFMILKVGNATEVRSRLLKEHRVCVRDCSSFELSEYIRIGIRKMDDNRRLATALKQVLNA